MGLFSRKKQTEKTARPAAQKPVGASLRRIPADSVDQPLPAKPDIEDMKQGVNPYESVSVGKQKTGTKKQSLRPEEREWRESGFNPYDTFSNLPRKRSWEDVPFDSVDKERRKP